MAYVLSLLTYLACPLGMGAMMWLMMRGTNARATDVAPLPAHGRSYAGRHADAHPDDQLSALRGELAAVDARIAAASDRSQVVKIHEAVEMAPAGRRT